MNDTDNNKFPRDANYYIGYYSFQTYNHTASNLAIYSHETSQDKLPEA